MSNKKGKVKKPTATELLAKVKPFPVKYGKYHYTFTPSMDGGFSVTCKTVTGVNAQGDTFEEALECAVSMTAFVEEYLADVEKKKDGEKKKTAKRPARPKTVK